jgi:hypothetical protein
LAPDRKNALLDQTDLTGIDFVYVDPSQVQLDVFFLTDPSLTAPTLDVGADALTASQVRIHAEPLPDVAVASITWATRDGRRVLRVTTAAPGEHVLYRLFLDDPTHGRIDAFFNDVPFSFKANCPSPFDCEPPPHECPPEAAVDFPVDLLARDFTSFRRALFDFASQRYPEWKDRLEADVGVMLAEIMAHLGDEMAYYQDRIAREHALETASQRRSLRRHARLVDYHVHDGLGATGWLEVQVDSAFAGPQNLPAGTDVWAESSSGEMVAGVFVPRRIPFEVGRGLKEALAGKMYPVTAAANSFAPHLWDETRTCLPVGATELWIDGHHATALSLIDAPPDRPPGRFVVLRTDPTDPALPARRHVVRLIAVEEQADPLGAALGISSDVTRLAWEEQDALPFEMDLEAGFTVRGNVVPITAGETFEARFSIGPSSLPEVPRAVERTGANASVAFLYTLPRVHLQTVRPGVAHAVDKGGLVWLGDPRDPAGADPELHLTEDPGEPWTWVRALLGTDASLPTDKDFTLDDGTWTRVAAFQRIGEEIVHVDYRDGEGVTIRFGDGEFGRPPERGSGQAADDSIFLATYRLGGAAASNVPAGAVTKWLASAAPFLAAVENPLATTGGLDPEDPGDVKRRAPEAFRRVTYRAVRPEDYAEAVERLDFVQRAGCPSFTWTGSWLTAFVTPDPRAVTSLADEQHLLATRQLDRFRQTGREAWVLSPRYADLDLQIRICVEPTSYPGDVEETVLRVLLGKRGPRPIEGFFHPDRFTFGTPLDRSELEAAIQRVPGVRAVEHIRIRRRGVFDWKDFVEHTFTPAAFEVIRVDADPLHPDRGTLELRMEGGA